MIILWLAEREQLKQTPPSWPSHSQGVWCSVSQCYTSLWLMVGLKETIKNVWWQADNLTQLFLIFQFLMLFGCHGLTKINDRDPVSQGAAPAAPPVHGDQWGARGHSCLLQLRFISLKSPPRINWLFLHSLLLLSSCKSRGEAPAGSRLDIGNQ